MSSSGMEGLFGLSPLSHSPTQQQTLTPPTQLNSAGAAPVRLTYRGDGTPVYNPTLYQSRNVDGENSAGNGFGEEAGIDGSATQPQMTVKRKRGRPRKYSPEGGSGGRGSTFPPPLSGESGGSRGRGRGRGTGRGRGRGRGRGASSGLGRDDRIGTSDIATTGSTGAGFTPYVITVKAGEDVSAKIMSFSQHGPRSICILTANGAISNVTLHQAAISGGTVTYEGRFEILSLSGSFLLSESGGQRSRTGGLSVSLAGPDGRVLGGGVAGLLTAASSVQVIVGSFAAEGMKEFKLGHLTEPPSAPLRYTGGASAVDSPPSRGTLSGSSGMPVSPLTHSIGAFNNNAHGLTHISWK